MKGRYIRRINRHLEKVDRMSDAMLLISYMRCSYKLNSKSYDFQFDNLARVISERQLWDT